MRELTFGDELASFEGCQVYGVGALRRAVRLVRAHWDEIERTAERLETTTAITV